MNERYLKIERSLFLIAFIFALVIFVPDIAVGADENKMFGLTIPAEVLNYWTTHLPDTAKYNSNAFPTALDWGNNDSQIKNQLSCGSCWAFASVALVENLGTKNDLSEQVVLSCATGSCAGGWYGNALKYFHDYGVPDENCYQYLIADGVCEDKCTNPSYVEKLSNYDYYGRWGVPTASTVNDLKNLLQSGPVIVSLYVPADGTFESYSEGIYNYNGGAISSDRGHAVLVVGYNDVEGYFKAKNSWGSDWGEAGYFRISYDDVTDDVQFGGYACTGSGAYTYQTTPVELSAFSAQTQKNQIRLLWTTSSESNNYGFDVEKSSDGDNFQRLIFIKGFGTTNLPQTYSFLDTDVPIGNYYYRLKQIDFDGQTTYSAKIEVRLNAPSDYLLAQNYPNPFNQATNISFELPEMSDVSLTIFNALGQAVKTLLDYNMRAGYHSVHWNGQDENGGLVPSGLYYYQIQAGDYTKTRRLVLIR